MKVVNAKILDSTHLELVKPIAAKPGTFINISIPNEEEDHKWQEAAKKRFFEAYSEEDAIYDKL